MVAVAVFVSRKCLVVPVVTVWSSPQRVLRADHPVQQSGVELCSDWPSWPHLPGGIGERTAGPTEPEELPHLPGGAAAPPCCDQPLQQTV